MAEPKTPTPDSSTHNATRELVAAGASYEKAGTASTWGAGADVKIPTDPDKRAKTEALLERLSKHFNAKATPGAKIGLPRDPDEIPGMNAKIAAWKRQGLSKCGERGCYHPLTAKRVADHGHDPIVFPGVGGKDEKVIAAECSWEPRHAGGLQFIPVRKPSDE